MTYRDLRDFMAGLEAAGELVRVREPVSARLEMTAVSDFVLRQAGPDPIDGAGVERGLGLRLGGGTSLARGPGAVPGL